LTNARLIAVARQYRAGPRSVHKPRQLTDLYLLALAVRRDGRFVTFDASVPLSPVSGAAERHLVVL
jgi:hypothetical protein